MAEEDDLTSRENKKRMLRHIFSNLLKDVFQTVERQQQLQRIFSNLNLSVEQSQDSLQAFSTAAYQQFEEDVDSWYDKKITRLIGTMDDESLIQAWFDGEKTDVQQLRPPSTNLPTRTLQNMNGTCLKEHSQNLNNLLAERQAQLADLRLSVTSDLQKLRSLCKQFNSLNLSFSADQENHP